MYILLIFENTTWKPHLKIRNLAGRQWKNHLLLPRLVLWSLSLWYQLVVLFVGKGECFVTWP